jgi:hypothetical protein
LDEQSFNLRGTLAIEPAFGHDPQIVSVFDQMSVQPEQFFHLSFYIITLHRVPDLPINGNRESMVRTITL